MPQPGDIIKVLDLDTQKEITCVVIKVREINGHIEVLVRRKNNKPFNDSKSSKWVRMQED